MSYVNFVYQFTAISYIYHVYENVKVDFSIYQVRQTKHKLQHTSFGLCRVGRRLKSINALISLWTNKTYQVCRYIVGYGEFAKRVSCPSFSQTEWPTLQ